jgi:hypothetical protein
LGLGVSPGTRGARLEQLGSTHAAARARRYLRAARDGTLIALPVAASIAVARAYAHNRGFAGDYQVNAWTAGRDLFHNLAVYVSPNSSEVRHFALFDWGAASAVLFAPLSLLPAAAANAIFAFFCAAAVVLALAVCDVRDWRIYSVVLLWPFVMLGWVLGNIELPMTLALALAWRYRDRPAVAGAWLALMISVKFIAFPVVIWLVATRRYAALRYTVIWALVINLAAWATVGFNQIPRYLALLPAVAKVARPLGTGVVSLCIHLGATTAVAYAVAIAVSAVLAVAAIRAGRQGADLAAFALSIVVCLVATPIMEPHYYTLLLIPLAVARPRFGPIWAAPLVLWVSLIAGGQWGTVSTTLVCLGVTACLISTAFGHAVRQTAPA